MLWQPAIAALASSLIVATSGATQAQSWIKLDVPYVGTPPAVVNAMLKLADVGPDDTVYDLGSGDGRIVISAIRDRGAKRGVGIELNPIRIAEAIENAKKAGVSDRAAFIEGDIFTADFSAASVVTMYLWDNVNLRLRPRLLSELAPGTRIVSHQFHMFDWAPDRQEALTGSVPVYFWIVPANVAGAWRGRIGEIDVAADLTQSFQSVSGTLAVGGTSFGIKSGHLTGRALVVDARDEAQSAILDVQVSNNAMTGSLTLAGNSQPVILSRDVPR